MSQLVTRLTTLQSAMGSEGLVLSAEQLLSDLEIRQLIPQLPENDMYKIERLLLEVRHARRLLEIEEVKRKALEDGSPEDGG